jgi:hypothetical protein
MDRSGRSPRDGVFPVSPGAVSERYIRNFVLFVARVFLDYSLLMLTVSNSIAVVCCVSVFERGGGFFAWHSLVWHNLFSFLRIGFLR